MSTSARQFPPATRRRQLLIPVLLLLAGAAVVSWWRAQAADQQEPLPVTGAAVDGLGAFDRELLDFMETRGIDAGALGVARNGEIVLVHGYGWHDDAHTRQVAPDTLFRLASLSKPVTAAAIHDLHQKRLLSLTDPVFCIPPAAPDCLLDISLPQGLPLDPRLGDIRVAHLLDHTAGWDRERSGDPMFQTVEIAASRGLPNPPSKVDIARYVLEQPLDHTPGSVYVYSNFGYLLLGLIIEEVSGSSYADYIRAAIFAPLDVGRSAVLTGASLPEDRDPREPRYVDPETCPSAFSPAAQVSCPDGGFVLEVMDAHGGLVASADAYARFMAAY